MKQAAIRAARTFFQAFLGAILTSGIFSQIQETSVVDLSALTSVGVSALAAGIIALISFTHNALEDKHIIPDTRGNN